METEAFAPAKLNLTLHVTGRRDDGYHLLDSLVAFARIGDTVRARAAPDLSLHVTGPRAAGLPAGDDNLVMRAARFLAEKSGEGPPGQGAALTLEKHLPPASGLGGGSGDAAAALRALARLWGVALPAPERVLPLGADVPVCLAACPARMTGIGGTLGPVPPLPEVWVLLVNPGVEVPTPMVFAALQCRRNPAMPARLPRWRDAADLAGWLRTMRNDLETPARRLFPVIDEVLLALGASPGCLMARMSGSGASCFGLYADQAAARAAQQRIRAAQPGWWVDAGALLRAAPAPDGQLTRTTT
ncbi:4-(cytidine 5'-diphospho)-2-C-methyl-D-erythritol kinase [Alkalilacustris brevis]|uniref:4-(cytidine 5'-diphospho)-2-C-methyl-D-erythritol kinase n=1 Tax=Alkalilacustris brevis TaxID=2026338 RepID=UPI000E0DE2F7|nr:4-(cytidine 5'-diphospho)-2-C-methyl-D-erythritol kinase [Alkalilacustris brevis]